MSDFNSQEFIQDFLDETGEHLRSVHQNLLSLEESLHPDRRGVDTIVNRANSINEIFRSFHTIKGLAGMVGLESAAEISHTLESTLKAVQQAKIELTSDLIDRILQGTRLLEKTIDTLRTPGQIEPPIQGYLDTMSGLLPDPIKTQATTQPKTGEGKRQKNEAEIPGTHAIENIEPALPEGIRKALNENDRLLLAEALSKGQVISLATFTPGAEKSARGENVNDIRQMLSQAGGLLKAAPIIDRTQVRFGFLIASQVLLSPANFPEMEWKVIVNPKAAEVQTESLAKTIAASEIQRVERGSQIKPASPVAPQTVRVDLERLDELMRLVGELFVCRARITDNLDFLQINPEDKGQIAVFDKVQQAAYQMEHYLRDLRRATIRARMVPLAEVFGYMPLAVRDLARASHKEVHLVMEGENVEIDRILVERLLDPLLHLVRNAIAHGIETPAERIEAGKPQQGTLTLRGQPAGDHILVSVCDDGRGIDFEQITRKAVDLGLWKAEDYESNRLMSDAEALDLISRAGFSTRDSADLGAGRGVGMDVVARMAAEIGGSLSMQSQPGQGTTFTLRLPLTLTIVNAIVIRCGDERYAISLDSIDEVLEIEPPEIVHLESGELYPFRGNSLVLFRLSDLFQVQVSIQPDHLYGLVGGQGDRRAALVVDQLISRREVVVRTISDPLISRPGIIGATELGDGSVILILDLLALFQYAISLKKGARRAR